MMAMMFSNYFLFLKSSNGPWSLNKQATTSVSMEENKVILVRATQYQYPKATVL